MCAAIEHRIDKKGYLSYCCFGDGFAVRNATTVP